MDSVPQQENEGRTRALRKHKKKITKFIRRDDVRRLRHLVRKHKICLLESESNLGHLLHLACRNGSDACLRFLLKKGLDPKSANENGDLAVHIALYRAIKGKKYAFSDLVRPLLNAFPSCLDFGNREGVSPRQLLGQLESKTVDNSDEGTEGETSGEVIDDWDEKLKEEVQSEYSQSWGTYEDDFCEMDKEPETYDSWAENLSRQYHTKQHSHTHHRHTSTRAPPSAETDKQKEQEFLRNMQKQHEEYIQRTKEIRKMETCKSLKLSYEEKFAETSRGDKNSRLAYQDVPWPVLQRDEFDLEDVILADVDKSDAQVLKKHLREHQIRWHPDRFLQRFGDLLEEVDRNRIMEKVNAISQELNQIINKYSNN